MASDPETKLTEAPCISRIRTAAVLDSIDLAVLPFLDEALASIADISSPLSDPLPSFSEAAIIDTHTHPVPPWFGALQPLAGGRETPTWNVSSHLDFMGEHKIKRSILCISTPQSNAFPGDKKKTIALSRMLNEYVAELARVFPERFSWLAVTALPYVKESITEVRYALEELGAIGISMMTNSEGHYPGDKMFDPLWQYLQERDGEKEIVFVHPTDPVIRLKNGEFLNSNPCE